MNWKMTLHCGWTSILPLHICSLSSTTLQAWCSTEKLRVSWSCYVWLELGDPSSTVLKYCMFVFNKQETSRHRFILPPGIFTSTASFKLGSYPHIWCEPQNTANYMLLLSHLSAVWLELSTSIHDLWVCPGFG